MFSLILDPTPDVLHSNDPLTSLWLFDPLCFAELVWVRHIGGFYQQFYVRLALGLWLGHSKPSCFTSQGWPHLFLRSLTEGRTFSFLLWFWIAFSFTPGVTGASRSRNVHFCLFSPLNIFLGSLRCFSVNVKRAFVFFWVQAGFWCWSCYIDVIIAHSLPLVVESWPLALSEAVRPAEL